MEWVGAGVSLVGALVALAAAGFARRSAWEVASLNHRIAALDREAEQFRADVAAVFGALTTDDPGPNGMEIHTAAAVAVLQSNPRTTPEVRAGAAALMRVVLAEKKDKSQRITGLQGAAREVLAGINAERAALLQERDRVRWLPWGRDSDKG